jgi:tetratricopeptide (TPR) repeat protein
VRVALILSFLFLQTGCAAFINSKVNNAADNLTAAIQNQDDPELVRDGAPAYLLLMDSLVEGSPDNGDILEAAATLYSAYAAVFVVDPERAARLSNRARAYAGRALCTGQGALCGLGELPFEEMQSTLTQASEKNLSQLFTYCVAWLVYIRAHSDDWGALADLAKVEIALDRVLELDESYQNGSPHLYLGILQTLRPPALGGEPEEARGHFERAIVLSDGKDLSINVEFARGYARLLYERELHDRLLTEVLEADPVQTRLTLTNTLAQRDARQLLDSADDYF